MTDTPRTKQLQEVRQKRLAFLEKISEASKGVPVSKNGINSSRAEKGVRKSVTDERFENSGLKDAAGKSSLNKPKPGETSGNFEGSSYLGRLSLVTGNRSSHDFKSSNDSQINKSESDLQRTGLVEKRAKKTPRDVKLAASVRQSTTDSLTSELRLLNDVPSKRSPKGIGVDSVNESKSLGRLVTLSGVSSETVRKASQDQSMYASSDKQPGISCLLNVNSISDSISAKDSAKQGFETYRIMRKDLPEKSGTMPESYSVTLNPVSSRRSSVKPSILQSKCFGSSEVVKRKTSTEAKKNALPGNFKDERKQETGYLGSEGASGKAADSSVSLQNGISLNSAALEDDDLQRLFKSSTFSVCNQDLKAGNSSGKSSLVTTISSDNQKPDEALTQSRNTSRSSIKSSAWLNHNGNSGDKGSCSDPRQSDAFSSSVSSSVIKSAAGVNHVDDAVKVSEETDETVSKHLPKSVHPSGSDVQMTAVNLPQPPPSESVEYSVPDFLRDIPKVNTVQRSQVPFSESNDFQSSVEPSSGSPASETLVSTLASTLNFGSVNLELVLGKDRMERLLKNIMEIDGSSACSLKASTITDVSPSDSYDLTRKPEDKPHVMKDLGAFECRDSHDTSNLGNVFSGAQASCESLGLKTHRPASHTLVNSLSSSSITAKREKTKCSFVADEIYAEAQMLKGAQGGRSRSVVAMAMEPGDLEEVRRNKPELPPAGIVDDRNAWDSKGTSAKLLSEVKESTLKTTGMCSNNGNCFTTDIPQTEPKGVVDSTERKKHRRRDTLKGDALTDSREEHIKGIRRKVQQQGKGNEDNGPEGVVENNSAPVACYTNPAIDRYFKSLENLSPDRESLLPKSPEENPPGDRLELSAVGRSLKKDKPAVAAAGDGFQQKLRGTKTGPLQASGHKNDGKVKDEAIPREVSVADHTLKSSLEDGRQHTEAGVRSKDIRSLSSLPEFQTRNTVTSVSSQDPLMTIDLAKVRIDEKHNHGDDIKACEEMQHLNAVDSSSAPTSIWKTDQMSDEKIPKTLEVSSSFSNAGMKVVDNKPVFAPILNVRDSEEFEYSEVGKRGMGSFGEFFQDEMSINLRDSGDGNAVGRLRNSSAFPQSQLKSIVEDSTMDSVNYDYVIENKLDYSEDLKATLHLNLVDSLDAEQERQRMIKKETLTGSEMKEDKNQQKKPSNGGTSRKSLSRSPERQQVDAVRSVPQKLKQEEGTPVAKSFRTRQSGTEDAEVAPVKNDEFYRDFVHHLVNDVRFKKTGLESKSSEILSSAPLVPKLQLNIDSSLPSKSVGRSLAKTSKASSSKSRPFASLSSSVLGKARVAWKEDDLVRDGSASVPAVPLSRQRPSSAKNLPKSSFPDDSSRSVGEALSRQRPWSAKKEDDFVRDTSASIPGVPLSRQRPWSAKILPQSSFPDDSSRSVGEPIRRQRPSSVGPRSRRSVQLKIQERSGRSRRKLTSSDVELVQSIEDFGGRRIQEQHQAPLAQSIQVRKAKGQSRRIYRFASEDYEKYSALSPRIQAGELSMLTSFPDEILLKIFSYLPRSNLSQCARVCQHFFRVAMDNSLWKCIELEEKAMTDEHLAAIGRKIPSSLVLFQCTGDKVTSNGLRQLFWECSESLRELRFSGCSKGHLTGENILLHATNRCRNITHLDGSWTNLSSQGIIAFSEESERLVSVCLNGCQSINDEAVQTLVARHGKHLVTLELLGLFGLTNAAVETICNCCKHLVTLTLGQCWKLTDSCLAQLSTNMPQLENLDLRGCKQIKDQTIHQLVKNCGQLVSLSLANCPNLTDSSLAEIAVQCPRLRSLDVCGCGKLTNVGLKTLISGCSMLMYLDLSSTAINHRSVTAIASYCSRRLEVLKLNFCKQMNMECLIRLVKNCKRLKKLYVYGVKGLHSIHELKMTNPNVWIEM